MTEQEPCKPIIQRALVLSGGGARGAYQAGVLGFLAEAGWTPDLICGTSIGAINAAAYGAGLSPEEMAELWYAYDRKTLRRFSLRSLFVRFRGSLRGERGYQPLADTDNTRAVFEKHIDTDKLRNSETRILVSAINMHTGRVRYFSNKVIDIDHLMAAAAIPLFFPWQSIGRVPYWDAGLMVNTPITPALGLGAREIIAVLHSPVGAFETGLPETGFQAFELAMEHMLTGSFITGLPDDSWNAGPDENEYEAPPAGSPRMEQAANGIKIRTVAPPEMLGISSMFNYSEKQAKYLVREGYRHAKMQLSPFL